jgi:hypothetical protein
MLFYALGCLIALSLYEAAARFTSTRRIYSNVHSSEFWRL